MEWQLFTYQKEDENKVPNEETFEKWVVRVVNAIRAENVQFLPTGNQVLVYMPANYNDELDAYGQEI